MKNTYEEISIRRKFRTAIFFTATFRTPKYPNGESSYNESLLRRNLFTVNFPFHNDFTHGKVSYGEIS